MIVAKKRANKRGMPGPRGNWGKVFFGGFFGGEKLKKNGWGHGVCANDNFTKVV